MSLKEIKAEEMETMIKDKIDGASIEMPTRNSAIFQTIDLFDFLLIF
jgi:hypothetical protein